MHALHPSHNPAGRAGASAASPPGFAAHGAAILRGQLICLCGEVAQVGSAEPQVDLEAVEPGHPRVDALAVEAAGKVLEVLAQMLDVWGVVAGDEDGVAADADVAFQGAEEFLGQMRRVRGGEGGAEAVAQWLDDSASASRAPCPT